MLLADGILWHLGAGLFFGWLALHFLSNRRRFEELEGGFVALVAWEGEPPRPLILRALRFLESECLDVLGTPIRLQQPAPSEASRAVITLMGRLAALRRQKNRKAQPALVFLGEPKQGAAFWARWNGSQWEVHS